MGYYNDSGQWIEDSPYQTTKNTSLYGPAGWQPVAQKNDNPFLVNYKDPNSMAMLQKNYGNNPEGTLGSLQAQHLGEQIQGLQQTRDLADKYTKMQTYTSIANMGIGFASGLWNAWMGYKNYQEAKKQNEFQRESYTKNFNNNVKDFNRKIDRAAYGSQSMGSMSQSEANVYKRSNYADSIDNPDDEDPAKHDKTKRIEKIEAQESSRVKDFKRKKDEDK